MQGLININGRQRIILVSNMPEYENADGKQYSIDTLSVNHPNTIFFTERNEYHGENIGNNIWMGGVNFTRVHGVDPNASSISIGDELITLICDPKTGLLSLKVGTKISLVQFIGFLNYKDNNSVDDSINTMNDEIYGHMVLAEKMIFASPVNKVALYFQFTPLASNGSTLPVDPSKNTISVPNVKIESIDRFALYSDGNYVEYMPNDPEIEIIKSYIQANGKDVYIDYRLPVYKYTFNVIDTGLSQNDDLNITPVTLRESDIVPLSAFGLSSDDGETSVIKRDETLPNKFSIGPIDYYVAIYSTNVVYMGTQETSYHVDLKTQSESTVELEYTVNNNDESGKNILKRSDIDNIINYRFFSGNDDVTSQVLNNTDFVEVISNTNGKLKIKFKAGFTRSSNGFDALTVKAIPASFNKSYNYTNYLAPASESNPWSNYRFNSTVSNYKSFNLIFDEHENVIYAGVNPFRISVSYINLDDASRLSEQNIENLLFNNNNFKTFTCGNYEDMCTIINNTSSATDNKYVPQGFDQVVSSEYRNLYIVLPTTWANNIFVTELQETDKRIEASNGDTVVYLKDTVTITQVGKYSVIKTIGSIVYPNNVLVLPTTKWTEITI